MEAVRKRIFKFRSCPFPFLIISTGVKEDLPDWNIVSVLARLGLNAGFALKMHTKINASYWCTIQYKKWRRWNYSLHAKKGQTWQRQTCLHGSRSTFFLSSFLRSKNCHTKLRITYLFLSVFIYIFTTWIVTPNQTFCLIIINFQCWGCRSFTGLCCSFI